jgi:hypothetical protein
LTESATNATPYYGPIVNWGKELEELRKDYETKGMGVAHGLQKDAIQNGWGARQANRGWSYEFRLVRSSDGVLYLTMTDSGTCGLIGKVYTFDEIRAMGTDDLPSSERLARFEAVFESGGSEGPGAYGRGKMLFNVASAQNRIYYDSKTMDGKYRLGRRYIHGREYDQLPRILEGSEAILAVSNWTKGALKPLQNVGTRIIIVEPCEEVVDSINDGTFLEAIEETWWEIIKKYQAKITVVNEDGATFEAKVPEEFGGPPTDESSGFKIFLKDDLDVDAGNGTIKVKHLHLFVAPKDLPDYLQGVAIHRKGMKVGNAEIIGIPDKLRPKFFGYVQLSEPGEDKLLAAEDLVHYSFSARHLVYKNLRNEIQSQADAFFEKLGFRRRTADQNEREKRLLEEAASDLNAVLDENDVPGSGSGQSSKRGIFLSIKGLRYPGGSSTVKSGSSIAGFWYVLKNTYLTDRKIQLDSLTSEHDKGEIEKILKPISIDLPSDGEWKSEKLAFTLRDPPYPKGRKISCVAKVSEKGKILVQKTFPVYFELDKETPPERPFSVTLEKSDFPKENSIRVDYGQAIKNIVYEVENQTSIHIKTRVRVYTVFVEGKKSIASYLEQDLEFDPSESKQVTLPEVSVTEDKYSEVGKGRMILRCSVVALEDSPIGATQQWTKGTRLGECNRTFWLNMDPKYGFFDGEETFLGGPNEPRSRLRRTDSERGWIYELNQTHPAYLALEGDEERQKIYNYEEMAGKVVSVLLRKNAFSTLKKLAGLDASESIENMPAEDVLDRIGCKIVDKLLADYYAKKR